MFDPNAQQNINHRWEREIARLSEVLGMEIDPDDGKLAPVKRIFPLFERLSQADPKELMQHADIKMDIDNPEVVEAFNKGRIMTASMILLTLIQNHLN